MSILIDFNFSEMASINNHISSGPLARPFLKWAGGKGQLLSVFRNLYPQELREKRIKKYYEPFLGSGAVFFDIMQHYDVGNAYLSDVNEELVLTYRVIQQQVSPLIDCLTGLEEDFLSLSGEKRSQFYYEQRSLFNYQRVQMNYDKFASNWVTRAAQLIFLNHTCFNGLFRVNSKGDFNTPVGDYQNPRICQAENLLLVSKLLDRVNINNTDFDEISRDCRGDAFVYFDPPYRPISKTASFTAYNKSVFGDQDQLRLFTLFKRLDGCGNKIMLSNSDPKNLDPADDFFDRLYGEFNILRVPARRIINSDASKRGQIKEIVVANYALSMTFFPAFSPLV